MRSRLQHARYWQRLKLDHDFSRARAAVAWAGLILAQGERRGLALKSERDEWQAIKTRLSDVRLSWHEFRLDASRHQADDAFVRAGKVKDKVWQRIMETPSLLVKEGEVL